MQTTKFNNREQEIIRKLVNYNFTKLNTLGRFLEDDVLFADVGLATLCLKTYDKNVFYINGHLHTGVSADSLVILNADKGVYSINLPAYGQPNAAGTFKITGLATYMEVYDKEVVFTLRNFQEGKAVGGFSRSITLK